MQSGNRVAKFHEIWQLNPNCTSREKMRRKADDGAEIMTPALFIKELWTGNLID